MDEDSWDTLSQIIDKDLDKICSKEDRQDTIHATWISLIARQQGPSINETEKIKQSQLS